MEKKYMYYFQFRPVLPEKFSDCPNKRLSDSGRGAAAASPSGSYV